MAAASLVVRVSAQVAEFQKAFADATRTAQKFEKDFATTASSVSAQQKRITDAFASFSGDKLAREAMAVAKAVEQIGGASRLTAKEQAQVNATVTEAIAKYRALGQSAPKSLLDLEQATRKVATASTELNQSTDKGTSGAGALAGAFGKFTVAGVAAGFVLKAAGAVAEFAGQAQKFGGIESSFQSLAAAAKQSGQVMLTSLQTGTRGLVDDMNLMQSANKALLLGLPATAKDMGELAKTATTLGRAMGQDATKSLDDLITALGRSSPLILDNLGLTVKVEEANERYAASLGRSASSLTDAEKKTAFYVAAMEAARKKTAELGDQTLTASERMTVAWNRISNNVTRGLSDINIVLGDATASFQKFFQFIGNAAKFKSWEEMAKALRPPPQIQGPQTFIDPTALARVATGTREMTDELKDAKTVIEGLTPAMRRQIDAAVALGKSEEFITRTFGLSATEQKIYAASLKETVKAQKDATKSKREQAQLDSEIFAGLRKTGQEVGKYSQALLMANKSVEDHVRGQRQLKEMMDGMIQPYAMWVQSLEHARAGVAALVPGLSTMNDALARQQQEIHKFIEQAERAFDEETSAGLNFGRALSQNIIGAFQGGGDVGKTIGASIGNSIASSIGKSLADALGGKLGGAIGGLLGPLGALGGSLFGGLFDKMFSSAGRDAVKAFGEGFEGGFGGLRTALNDLGSEGDQLWTNLTQRVSKGNVEQARSAIAAIESALDAHKRKAEETASAVEAAQERETAAIDAATAGIKSRIADLTSQYDSLFKSIQNEAPEEVMGIVESLAREQMRAISAERSGLEDEMDRVTKNVEDNLGGLGSKAEDAARAIEDALKNIKVPPITVPFDFESGGMRVPHLASGGIVRQPTLALIGESGPEAVVPLGSGGAGGSQPIIVKTYLDGRLVAESTARHLPSVLGRMG